MYFKQTSIALHHLLKDHLVNVKKLMPIQLIISFLTQPDGCT